MFIYCWMSPGLLRRWGHGNSPILPLSDYKYIYIFVYLFGAEKHGSLRQGVRTSLAQTPLKELPRCSGGPGTSLQLLGTHGWRKERVWAAHPGRAAPCGQVAWLANSGPLEPEMFALQGALVTSQLQCASQLFRCDVRHRCSKLSCWAGASSCALARTVSSAVCCRAAAVVPDDCPRAAANAVTEKVTAAVRDNLGVFRVDL